MNNLRPLVIALLVSPTAWVSCNNAYLSDYGFDQLSSRDIPCSNPSEARKDEIEDKLPKSFLKGFKNENAIKRLASIPDPYLDYLVDLYDEGTFTGISQKKQPPGVGGVTRLSGRSYKSMQPRNIEIAPGRENFALQHEVGHAVESQIRKKASEIDSGSDVDLGDVIKFIRKKREFRSYARSSDGEAFAELFANYYCSPKSYEYIQKHFPSNMEAYLAKIFEPAIWGENGSSSKKKDKSKREDESSQISDSNSGFSLDPAIKERLLNNVSREQDNFSSNTTPDLAVTTQTNDLPNNIQNVYQNPQNNQVAIHLLVVESSSTGTSIYASTGLDSTNLKVCFLANVSYTETCKENIRPNHTKNNRLFYHIGDNLNFEQNVQITSLDDSGNMLNNRVINKSSLISNP